jgi:quinoprotein relay system zinc metallohydrolase 2
MGADNLGDIANIGFIVGSDSVAVIDPGGSPAVAKALFEAVKQHTDLPVSHIILTHLHPDHMFGAALFPESAEIVAHERYPQALVQRGQFYLDRFREPLALEDLDLVDRDILVAMHSPVEIDLGGRKLLIQAYPTAHTDNDISIWDANSETLWASDLVFVERIPSLDGSLRGWLSVLDQIQTGQAPKWVVPGHGESGAWLASVQPQREYLEQLAAETRTAIAANQRLSEAVDEIATDGSADWLLFDLRHRGNVTKAWTELEWE